MESLDCPPWEYKDHPDCKSILPVQCRKLLYTLRSHKKETADYTHDTRQAHSFLLKDLTPTGHEYYAGNYRGSNFRCLKFCEVGVGADRRVGYPAGQVELATIHLSSEIAQGISTLDQIHRSPNAHIAPEQKLYMTVVVAAKTLEYFLRIHPYLNGNGHAGRFVVWSLLWHYDYWPTQWPLDESPPYHTLLSTYRDGDPVPLEEFILGCL